ncbi:MAG: Rpn family recombination-promoting nuclease/putative transposase [Bacteroidales bacterium]
MRYLDPKNDLVFKRIFGEHPELVKSLLNALMPLEEGQQIDKVEYLTPEMVPEIPGLKDSIVDVRCVDNRGRHFIVEMQMLWTPSFQARVLFNASKAFVRQLDRGRKYASLQPVYALSLVDDIFVKGSEDFYHHYSIVNIVEPEQKLEGLEFVFIELPKFKPEHFRDKRMAVLWLRFLTEIKDGAESVPQGLTAENEIVKALEILQESAFSKNELGVYERIWDKISTERTLVSERTLLAREEALREGREEGRAEGRAEGREEGVDIGLVKGFKQIVDYMESQGRSLGEISEMTGLSIDEIEKLLNK